MTKQAGEFAPWLGVFETLWVIDGKPLFFAEHRAELARAMEALGLATEFDFAAEAATLPTKSGRWRWIVTPEETRTLFSEEDWFLAEPVELSISPVRVGSNNWDARFKTISYLTHAQAWKLAGSGDAVLLNEHGHVASASRGNIFWRRGDRMFTPAHEAGCRRGVVRDFVLKHFPVVEGHFPLAELVSADEIFVTNSMKGIIAVGKIDGRSVRSSGVTVALGRAYDKAVTAQLSPS